MWQWFKCSILNKHTPKEVITKYALHFVGRIEGMDSTEYNMYRTQPSQKHIECEHCKKRLQKRITKQNGNYTYKVTMEYNK